IDYRINMTRRTFLTAAEAAAALGVRLPTLYAYVSRGLLRSEPGAGGRARGYPAADVEALRQRSAIRRDPPRAVRQALDWGAPVLDSALTLIAGGRLFYRGEDAVELARRCGGAPSAPGRRSRPWCGGGRGAAPGVPSSACRSGCRWRRPRTPGPTTC